MLSPTAAAAAAIVSLAFLLLFRPGVGRKASTLKDCKELPGPKGPPLVGNLAQIPKYHSWLKFKQWADEFGPIYQLNLAGSTHIIVASEEIANDLCRERGTLYSGRPQLPMAARLLSDNLRPLLLPYGPIWRAFRKFTHSIAMPSMASSYTPLQEEEALRTVHDLVQTPAKYEVILERYAASVAMRLNYGTTLHTGEEPAFQRLREVNHNLERIASPGAYLVDTFPSLMRLPAWLAPFKREGARLHAEEYSLFASLVHNVAARDARGDPTVTNTFTKQWLDSQQKYPALTADHGIYVLGTVSEAAAGTTAAALKSWFLAMVLHPLKFAKIAAELDAVVGDSRLPMSDDLPQLPYLRACVKETMRWRPVTAGGLPHVLDKPEDDMYRGYRIPRGAIVHPVQWAIHRDPALYPRPEEFLPERWLESGWPTYREPLEVYPNLTNYSCFGFGRRICPGHHIAERSLNVEVAMVAWACQVGVREETGRPALYDYTEGFNAQPRWFDFELTARKGREEIVRERYADVWAK